MASKKLPRLSKSLLEKPQLITLEKFQEISDVLDNRTYLKNPGLFLDFGEDEGKSPEKMETEDIGILRVEGPTTYKPTGWETLCGGVSYVSLIEQMKTFAAEGKNKVVMWVNSPGGQAYRMMSTSRQLRKIADENGIQLIAYVDGMACSAGMGLASSCHEIVTNPESELGSIGVVVSLINNSKQLENAGIERKFITAGESKVPFEDDGSFKEGFIDDIQESVNDLYNKFVSHVATLRNIDEQIIRDTQARVFKAEKSVELGLADKMMEEEEFFEYLESISPSTSSTAVSSKEALSKDTQPKGDKMSDHVDVAALESKLAEMQALMESQSKQLETYHKKEELSKRQELDAQLSVIEFLSDSKEALLSTLLSTDVEDTTKELLTTIIDNAQAKICETKEELSSEITELKTSLESAEKDAETARSEAEQVKKEFGGKQSSVEGAAAASEPSAEQGVDRTSQLANFVKTKLASKK